MAIRWKVQDLYVSSVRSSVGNGFTNVEQQDPVRIARFAAAKGMRELLIRKAEGGKIGITVRRMEEGKVLVCGVARRSPAFLAGLRYGDEILCLEDVALTRVDSKRLRELVEKNTRNSIKLHTRDKPGERYVTLTKDEQKGYGFQFVNGEITCILPKTPAEQRGLERKQQIIEVNEEIVVGMKDEDVEAIIMANGDTVTLCVVPLKVYRQLLARLSSVEHGTLATIEM